MFRTDLKGALQEREVRVVRHHRLRERRELHTSTAELGDLLHDFVEGSFAAVQRRTDLHGSGSDYGHGGISFLSSGTSTPGTGNRAVLEHL